MAINDLKEELQKDIRIDSVLEKRICDVVLQRLEKDTCNDVRAMAVQWCVALGAPAPRPARAGSSRKLLVVGVGEPLARHGKPARVVAGPVH